MQFWAALRLSCFEQFWDRFDGHVTGGVAADAAFAAWRNGGSRVWVSLFTTVGCFCGCVGGFDLLLFLGPESDIDCIVSCPLCLVCWEFTFFFSPPCLHPHPLCVCVCEKLSIKWMFLFVWFTDLGCFWKCYLSLSLVSNLSFLFSFFFFFFFWEVLGF